MECASGVNHPRAGVIGKDLASWQALIVGSISKETICRD
ncbi:hypothetical protein YSA_09069 [Pseudomonas putida ND6]|uniref:Uncharacterized protein n=1 Tax=Pseudomonas putida ND6 TaxID=231023 RepID=I3V1Q1_PSEPU|nr:hypothetical protein YSA_09069 [Pseudomonas putida ND6]